MNSTVLNVDQPKIAFPHYTSDGPGYSGLVEVVLQGDHMQIITEQYERTRPPEGTSLPKESLILKLGHHLPELLEVSSFDKSAHMDLLMRNFQEHDFEDYFQDGEFLVDPEKIKILKFKSGSCGFLMIHGEACYFTLVVDKLIRLSIDSSTLECSEY